MDADPPKLTQLIAALTPLGDPTVADQQARKIHPVMLNLLVSDHAHGHDIGRDVGGFYAHARPATIGLARELRDIRGIARKAVARKISVEDWITTWAALPERTRRRLWRPRRIKISKGWTIDPATLAGSYSARGFAMIAPKPEEVLPAIEAELAQIKTAPGSKLRQANVEERVAIEAIRNAYRTLTGRKGGRVIRDGQLQGPMIRLGRAIDGIYGTRLFAGDSRRLR